MHASLLVSLPLAIGICPLRTVKGFQHQIGMEMELHSLSNSEPFFTHPNCQHTYSSHGVMSWRFIAC